MRTNNYYTFAITPNIPTECGTHGRGEYSVQGFGGKETTWKTMA
jgi:hypothetical protein